MKENPFSSPVGNNLKAFPEIIEKSLDLVKNNLKLKLVRKKYRKIFFAGMGGSGIAGEIVRAIIASVIKTPVFTVSEPALPAFVDSETLIVISTYSGDTVEMLSVFNEAVRKKASVIVLSSGGKISRLCSKHKIPLIILPLGLQPRAALGYFLVPIFFILGELGIYHFDEKDWFLIVKNLKKVRAGLGKSGTGNYLDKISETLTEKIPVILASAGTTEAAGYRFKTQLNENAKLPAILGILPELVHNEIMALASIEKEKNVFSLIFFESDFDSPLVKKMRRAVKNILGENFSEIFVLKAKGTTLLEQILFLVFLTDLVSIKAAYKKNVDPTPVFFINKVKEFLKNNPK